MRCACSPTPVSWTLQFTGLKVIFFYIVVLPYPFSCNRIQGKQHRPLSILSWQRPRNTWRMCLHTSKLFHFAAFVVEWGVLHKPSHVTPMDKGGGQWSQPHFCLACWRMQRAMLRYWMCPFTFPFIAYAKWHHLSLDTENHIIQQKLNVCDSRTGWNCVCWQVKGLDVDTLFISHIQVNKAQKQRRRTYRAHGRINRMCSVFSVFKWAGSVWCYLWFILQVKAVLRLKD